ncbi:STAS/SEC14 domain-containing protein [Jannaschia sp. 2305UL9-9]|uniref:STAS/SEC14 domain-containing protein n=1 Tax=Jannaschia sp. 2305UL9-9 TaxID=3121638 RepID=UPI003529CFD4
MFEITKKGPSRVDITIAGKIDAEKMRAGLDALLSQSEGMSGGAMLYRISDFAMPDFSALVVEMQRLPQLFGLLGRFSRCAVISDAMWLRTAAQIEGAVLPGLKIRAFDTDDIDDAEAWLARTG